MQESYFCKLNLPQWCALWLLPPVWTLKFFFFVAPDNWWNCVFTPDLQQQCTHRGIAAMTYPHTHFLATGRE